MTKFLIVGPAWIGDMVMLQTLLKLLKQLHSDAIIDVVAPKNVLPLLAMMPEVRHAIEIDIGHGELGFTKRYRLGTQLRAEKYDQAIVTPNTFKSALIPFFANIPRRTGWLGEQRYFVLNDARRLDKEKYPLMVQRFAALAFDKDQDLPKQLPYPKLMVAPGIVTAALAKLDLTPPAQPILALCPGAEYGPAKRWPAEYYAEVAKEKLAEGWAVWLFGSPKEMEAAEIIQDITHHKCINLIGRTNLIEAAALLSLATNVVCNDSGLMHVAVALDKPAVVIYGSSSPKFTPPLSDKVEILSLNLDCSPCFKRECPLGHLNCLMHLKPDQVIHTLRQMN